MIDLAAASGRARRAVATLARLTRTIIGAPDYERYVAHACAAHPERAPLSRDEFARERLAARYDRPGSRCC